ncbi:uncharacterized protein LOC118490409 [Helianthus annuus]|uniref:uncharacterized protein LOC118490409 n=1 Tax=Helianthus annuus TaxID=4232 RepID=UPI001652CD2D|nr:uncharacterized protein LOC118490409 [Helianthus annuus]
MTVSLGFFSFRQRDGSPKLMTPPKGMTKWKMKFFYIKAAAIVANMTFQNVTETIITETIAVPSLKTVEWFPRLQTIEWVTLSNTQLWVLHMMLTRRNKKSKPVVREKSGEDAPLWRMFAQDFRGQVETVICADGEEEFNVIIRDNFRVPTEAALAVELPRGKGDLGALGDPDAKGVPKRQVVKGVRFRQKKIPEVTVVPHLVPQAAGISYSPFRRYMDYVIVSDTLEGLGTAAGSQSVVGKRQVEETAAGAGGPKRRRLQSKRTGPTPKEPAVTVELQDKDFSIFNAPSSPPHSMGAGAGASEEPSAPFVKLVPDSTVRTEGTAEKVVTQIFDTVDSSNNLISPNEGDNLGLRFSDSGKQKSDAEPQKTDAGPQKSSASEKGTGSSAGGAGYDGPPIQPGESELEYYYRTYTQGRSPVYHRPLWTVMQGDDISNDPSTCKEILGGLGTPYEVERARSAPWELRINQLSTMLVGSSIVANAILEDYKVLGRREEEAARLRAEAEEIGMKSFPMSELTNTKAANAALVKEKAAAEAVAVKAQQAEALAVKALGEAKETGARTAKALDEAKERENRTSKALEEANAERTRLGKVVASLQADVKAREVAVKDLTACVSVAEERANAAVEAKDALTSSFNQLEIVQAIMDAPETATGLDLVKERARDAGFKAGYNRCIAHMNVMSIGGVIEERSGFRDVDTEGRLNAAVASFYDTSLACVEELDDCLEAADYG